MAWRMVAEVFCTKCLYSGKFFLVALCSFSLVDEESWALQLCNNHWKCAWRSLGHFSCAIVTGNVLGGVLGTTAVQQSLEMCLEESWALQLCNSHWKCACKGTSGVGRAAFQIIW